MKNRTIPIAVIHMGQESMKLFVLPGKLLEFMPSKS